MILVLASSLYEHDPQNLLLESVLRSSGKEYVLLNPMRLADSSRVELIHDRDGVRLLCDGSEINPESVYMARNLRLDCILDIPNELSFTTLFRYKVDVFWEEVCTAIETLSWAPGTLANVRRAESKIFLLHTAQKCGLKVPGITRNSFRDISAELQYRKVLGYPFSVSYDKEDREEVGITLHNKIVEGIPHDPIPWQWQSYVKATSQIRCVVVGNKIHSYQVDSRLLGGKSLREATDDGDELVWKVFDLPNGISTKLLSLMETLRLRMCCPEFLVDEDGSYIFIDLNPCGDWFGFIDEEENQTIAREIVNML